MIDSLIALDRLAHNGTERQSVIVVWAGRAQAICDKAHGLPGWFEAMVVDPAETIACLVAFLGTGMIEFLAFGTINLRRRPAQRMF